MRIVFMGSGELACPSLLTILRSARDEVVRVVTQPDRPKGRGRRTVPCSVKALAEEHGLPVMAPDTVGQAAVVEELAGLAPDIIVVAAYGQYIPQPVLRIPPRGAINVHPSLLPKYRGAAPVQWAIARGETKTGVTVLFVAAEMDAGDIILQESVPVAPEDTAATLSPRLAEVGAGLVLRALDLFRAGDVPRRPQDHEQATLAPKLKKEDGRIPWSAAADEVRNRIRGFQPWPGCFCETPGGSGRYLRVFSARVEEGSGSPGQVLAAAGDGPLVATGRRALRLLEVQPEGRRPMSGRDFLNGHQVVVGEVWG